MRGALQSQLRLEFLAGAPAISVPTHVRDYAGGSSHVDRLRDNPWMIRTHTPLVLGLVSRLPRLRARRFGAGA